MADIVTANVGIVYERDSRRFNGHPASGVTLAIGDAVYFDASGNLVKSNAGAVGTAKFAGIVISMIDDAVTYCKEGHIAGFDVSALAYGAKVYLSDTAGKLGTAAGTNSVIVGTVVSVKKSKVLYVESNWLTQL